jgi:predicted MFS family arabinose efflux permease
MWRVSLKPDTAHPGFGPIRGVQRRSYIRSVLSGYFFLTGAMLPVWASRIPAVKEQSGVDAQELGLCLLCLGLGAMITARVGGALLDRCPPRYVIAPAAVVASLCLSLPGFATSALGLGAALFTLGVAHSLLNVSLNTQVAQLQGPAGRSHLSTFHAFVSLGASFGALCGVVSAYAGLDPLLTFQVAGAAFALAALAAVGTLLRHCPSPEPVVARDQPTARGFALSPLLLLLGGMSFAAMLTETAVQDWGALFVQESLNSSGTFAASAFAVFTAAMTVGRFLGDRLVLAMGRVNLLRFGALAVASGFAVCIGIPWPSTILAGFALIGLGLANVVPQVFSAASEVDPRRVGKNLGTVVAIGYMGPLLGAPLIGTIAAMGDVGSGLLLPLSLMCVLALCASAARSRRGV